MDKIQDLDHLKAITSDAAEQVTRYMLHSMYNKKWGIISDRHIQGHERCTWGNLLIMLKNYLRYNLK
jgi:hypothetical protein